MQTEQLRNEIKNIVPLMNKKQLDKMLDLIQEIKEVVFKNKTSFEKVKNNLLVNKKCKIKYIKTKGKVPGTFTVFGTASFRILDWNHYKAVIPTIMRPWCLSFTNYCVTGRTWDITYKLYLQNRPVYIRPCLVYDEKEKNGLDVGDEITVGGRNFTVFAAGLAIMKGTLVKPLEKEEISDGWAVPKQLKNWYLNLVKTYSAEKVKN